MRWYTVKENVAVVVVNAYATSLQLRRNEVTLMFQFLFLESRITNTIAGRRTFTSAVIDSVNDAFCSISTLISNFAAFPSSCDLKTPCQGRTAYTKSCANRVLDLR